MTGIRKILAAALALTLCAAAAQAQVIGDGAVTWGDTVTQTAAAGGVVESVSAQEGERLEAGDTVARLSLTRVYAPCDGTVETLFAEEGASADDAVEKYGAVLTLLPERRYTMYASAEYAYKSLRTAYVSAGQAVYMKCTADGSHRGTGRVTEIDGETFTIEATGGAFYNGETVYVYLEDDCEAEDRIAKATVVAADAEAVTGSGDIARMYVAEGDFVEKGQLLFELLGALPEGGDDADAACALTAEAGGYVVSVHAGAGETIEAGAPLVTLCPDDGLVASVQVAQSDLASVAPGKAVWLLCEIDGESLQLEGTVRDIAYLPETGDDGEITYAMRVDFDGDGRLLPGMAVSVSVE